MEKAIPKVSILVPIYNVERYLRKCLDSLTAQTLYDVEIICLDDGSTDGSSAICDEYAAADPRIRVLHKPNSGYGATMNIGLDMARGEYIGILESDDWAEPDMYETLYTLATTHQVQVVKSNFYKYTTQQGDELQTILPENDVDCIMNPKERSDIFFTQPSIWSAIYLAEFLKNKEIRFLESPGASYQDIGFNFKVWATADQVWLTPRPLLHYRMDNAGSSVNSKGKVFCVRDEWDEIERYMERYPAEKKASVKLRTHCKFANYMWNLERLTGKEKEQFRKYFWREYKRARHCGELKLLHRTYMDEVRYMKRISPNPIRWTFIRLLLVIIRIFAKRKIRNNRISWSILFGLIRRDGGELDMNPPTFWEKRI